METTNCIKEVLRAAEHYNNNSSQLAYLLRQLEALQNISSRSSYIRQLHSLDEIELVSCLTFLVDVVREVHRQRELMQRVIKILLNLSHDEYVRKLLFETFNLSSYLAAVVVTYYRFPEEEQTMSDALQLLQRISYGHRVDYHMANMEDLLKILITNVLNQTETLISPVLGTLANLCRNNVLVQSAIKNMCQSEFKTLLKTLCGFFGNQNKTLVIFSVSVLTSLCLNVFFESNNVEQTLQTIFGIIKNSFKTVAWKYAADLLTDLLRYPQMQLYITKYRHLNKCINEILNLLPTGSEESAAEIFELLLSLCSVPSIRQSVNSRLFSPLSQNEFTSTLMISATKQPLTPDTDALLCCLHWAAQDTKPRNRAPCLALDFLIDSCQECLFGTDSFYPIHQLAPVLTNLLSREDQTDAIEKTLRLVRLLNVLCSNKESREALGSLLAIETISNVLEKSVSQKYSSACVDTSTNEGLSSKEESAILILDLAWRLHKFMEGLTEYLLTTLKVCFIVDLLAKCHSSINQDHVEMALRLMAYTMGVQDARPDVILCGSIACLNKQSLKRRRIDSDLPHKPESWTDRVLENKENQNNGLKANTSENYIDLRSKGDSGSDKDETTLANFIERMESIIEPKDTKTTEIIEVFEHRIKALQIKEEHMNNLLEAKSLSITQADRLIAQLRAEKASHFTEAKKLQNILKDCERKSEQMMSQMNEMRICGEKDKMHFEKLIKDAKEEIETVKRERDENAEKCMELEEQVAASSQENRTLASMMEKLQDAHETLKEQYNVSCNQSKQLEEERKNLSKQLKEKDTSLQKLSSSLQALQNKYNDTEKARAELEKEKEDIEAYVDKLRNQLSSSENSCRQLQQRAVTLEDINRDQESQLKMKTDKIGELEAELEKHNQIVSFISNLQLKNAGGKK
ncbi:unnamed protein product [Lymnaea stagnalis]|uniref:CIP2A N-terminal domain-containing protein n=1 Tax=Lymnaea stagnalis TaxID=6523 RepID=A0AAV2I1H5_LYMST